MNELKKPNGGMKPLLKDYCSQAGETVLVLLNTPGYQPLYVFPADTGAL